VIRNRWRYALYSLHLLYERRSGTSFSGEQLADGGWNCDAPRSVRCSFHSIVCVLESLLEYERRYGVPAEGVEARRRCEEYSTRRWRWCGHAGWPTDAGRTPSAALGRLNPSATATPASCADRRIRSKGSNTD
jgi:hypothetical protein